MKRIIALAQMNPIVGDIRANVEQIIALTRQAQAEFSAGLVVFPELTLTGYPPEDLLLRQDILRHVDVGLQRIAAMIADVLVVVGHPQRQASGLFNAASVVSTQGIIARYQKHALPNYGVFDEVRYFQPGQDACVFDFHGVPIGITICEDMWGEEGPVLRSVSQGARLLINLNASPFHLHKHEQRLAVMRARIKQCGVPIVYVNQVGGQDELVFDGGSFVLDARGKVLLTAPTFQQSVQAISVELDDASVRVRCCAAQIDASVVDEDPAAHSIYSALLLGVRDYVRKNGFQGAILGLSGGIDSALTLALAADALGGEHVEAVMMPTRYTADMSAEDAQTQARCMHVGYRVIPIEKPFATFLELLQPAFEGYDVDATEENIQSRCRGILLMAMSNKTGKIVLTTGNKSEMAVGYATLYGDMAGGFAPLKDVSKLMVYRLAKYRNRLSPVIPERVIARPPSAELAPDQKDTDSLPPYEILDAVIEQYVEQDASRDDIIAQGYDADIVDEVLRMIDRNEYKRRQAPPGVKITARAFGRDRRYPITSGFVKHHR